MKPLEFIGTSKEDLKKCPKGIRETFGHAFFVAQNGEQYTRAKPLKGFGSAKVLEVIEHDKGGTYRGVYTVRFKAAVYVLHVFQKKSKIGIKTPKQDIEKIRQRLKEAEDHYNHYYKA